MSDKHEVRLEQPEPGVQHATVTAPAADILKHVHRLLASQQPVKDKD